MSFHTPRRDFLRLGVAGAFGYGLGLPQLLAAEHGANAGISLIYVFLKGGLSTIDSWDMKPAAPAEIRGEFNPIKTKTPGIELCELLPHSAKETDKFSLVRGFGHRNSDHGPADHYMLTGYHPVAGFNPSLSPNNQRPAWGSIITRELGPRGARKNEALSVPAYVCLPSMHPSAGPAYLGATCAPLVIEADPAAPDFAVPDLMPPLSLSTERLERRQKLLAEVDRFQKSGERKANAAAESVGVFRQKAFDLMTSPAAKQAFDLAAEKDALRDAYGRHTLGQSCLMARRLVEAGVRCVTIEHSNWDTHDGNFATLRRDLLPQLDSAMAALFRDLAERGMLERTIVLVTGEFGRTPRINKNAGRDHWGPAFTIALGGGGLHGGRIVGASDERAEKPLDTPYGPEDLAATLFHLMGIDPKLEIVTPEGRPVAIVNGGRVMRELL